MPAAVEQPKEKTKAEQRLLFPDKAREALDKIESLKAQMKALKEKKDAQVDLLIAEMRDAGYKDYVYEDGDGCKRQLNLVEKLKITKAKKRVNRRVMFRK